MRPTLLLLGLLLPACAAAPPEFLPGVTRRADVLLALGEPLLALDGDTVLLHAWIRGSGLRMIPPHRLYRHQDGILRRTDFAVRDPVTPIPRGPTQLVISHVVHEFDASGLLVRRSP